MLLLLLLQSMAQLDVFLPDVCIIKKGVLACFVFQCAPSHSMRHLHTPCVANQPLFACYQPMLDRMCGFIELKSALQATPTVPCPASLPGEMVSELLIIVEGSAETTQAAKLMK